MARNGFFGVKNAHIARLTNEETFTYEKPIHIPGTVEIKIEPSIEQSTSHGDNETWLDKYQDNGGSITWSLYDIESTPELRALLADIIGFDIDEKGRLLATSGKTPKPFAFMCEQPDTSLESAVASTSARASPHPSMQRHLRTSPTSRSLITILRSVPSSCRAAGAAATSTHMAILTVTTNSSKR